MKSTRSSFFTTIFCVLVSFAGFSQKGKHGNYTVPLANTTVNTYTSLTTNAAAGATSITVANNAMNGGVFTGPLEQGDLILIIQMQGATMDINTTPVVSWGGNYTVPNSYFNVAWGVSPESWGGVTNYNNAGRFEKREVAGISPGNVIELTCGLVNSYTASGHVQIVRIPRFNNLTVSPGLSIVPPLWNGTTGGIVAVEVQSVLNIGAGATISATAAGFRGGALDPSSYPGGGGPTATRPLGSFEQLEGSEKGEGIGGFYTEYNALFSRYGVGAPANGGGGGGYQNTGGGGGSNVVLGTYTGKGTPIGYPAVWNLETAGFGGSTSGGGGRGGYALSQSDQNELVVGPNNALWSGDDRKSNGGYGGHPLPFNTGLVFFGGGGGAGDQDGGQGGAGGRGGGAVFITCYGTITGTGTIQAAGGNGQKSNPSNIAPTSGNPRRGNDGAGGGGAGGVIHMENRNTIPAAIVLNVRGGDGGNHDLSLYVPPLPPPTSSEAAGPGGSGSGGMVVYANGAAPTRNLAAGTPGSTNSSHMVNFPPNGATSGTNGINLPATVPFHDITAVNPTICAGNSTTLTATVFGTLPGGGPLQWYTVPFGGVSVGSGTTYTTPVLATTTTYYVGSCPGTFRIPVVVTVAPPDNSSFNYSAASFCQSGTDPTPTITGLAGGNFTSSPAGLSINATTGTIDVSASTVGTYTVTYTTTGPCPTSSNQSVTITALTNANFSYSAASYCVNAADPTPTPVTPGGTYSSSPAGLSINASTGTIDVSASTPGTYTVTYSIGGACPNSSNQSVTINALDNATFNYVSASYCVNAVDPTPTITGLAGGMFSSTAGLSINPSTGTIDVSASTPGAYTVTYTTSGTCPNSSNVSVTINGLDNASFNYSAASYCVNAADPTPTITGLAGGTFSSTAGLSINVSTGTIDVSASTPGTYTVTYTTSGACPNSSNVSVTITALDNASFNYSAASYCVSGIDPTPTITGLAGGTFTSAPAGLSINASTGLVDLSASTIGTYTITYTTNGACPNSSNVSFGVTALDNASFSYALASYCVSGTDPTPTPVVAGGTYSSSPAGLSINAGTGTIDLSASTPGSYTVTYTTGGACSNSSNQTIAITTLDDASFSYSATAYCQNAVDPTPTITGAPGGTFTSTAGLSINASTGVIDVSASTPGTYTVTYTTSGACSNSSNASVTINALDNAGFNYSSASYCVNAVDPTPTITGLAGGTFSSTAGLSINTSTGTIDVSSSTPGTYTVTYTTAGACPNSSNVSVTINALDNASFSYAASSYCANAVDPTPTITGLAGGTFSSTAGLSINTSTGVIDVSASTPGTYSVTYTTAGSCPNSSSVSVTINALDNAGFNYSAASYCANALDQTPTITGLAGGTFSSTAGLVINGVSGVINVSGSTPGTYTVTYTTNGTCPNSSNVSVTINALDNASFSYGAAAYCVNAVDPTPTISGLAGGTFSSTAGLSINVSTGTIDVSASTPGTYTVTYTTAGACPNSSNVSVTINALDNASFNYGAASYCVSATDPTPTITGLAGGTFSSTAGLSINASTGTIDVSASTPGTYTVTYTTAGSCPNSSNVSVTITALDNASFNYSAAAYCVNTVDPTPTITGVAGGSFSSTAGLSINASTGTIDVSASTPGTYTVTYTTSGACGNSSNVSVTINALDNAGFSYSSASYCVNSVDPTPTITGLAGGTFSSTAGLSINAATGTIDVSASTPGTYSITYTTNGSCPNTSSANVTINNVDNATFSLTATCTGATATVSGLPGGTFTFGTPPIGGAVINASTGTISGATSGATYDVTYTTSGACPNSSNQSVTVLTTDDPSFTLTANCGGATANVTGTAGGTFTFTVLPSDGATINATTGTISNASSNGTYAVTYTTNGTCPASLNQNVTTLPSPMLNPIANQTACDQFVLPTITGTNLSGSEAFYSNSQAAGGTVITGPLTTSQTVYVYDSNMGCTDEISFTVTINTTDDASFTLTNFCEGSANSATITGVTGGTFSYTTPTTDGSTINPSSGQLSNGVGGTTYSVLYTTNGVCPNSSTQTVQVYQVPAAPVVSADQVYCAGDVIADMTATSGMGGTINWYLVSNSGASVATGANYKPSDAIGVTFYYATETVNGCESPESTIMITIESCDIMVPTAFTPNGDGAHDDWEIPNLDVTFPNNVVKVYNRWGNLLFESAKGSYETNRWDGTYNNEPLPVGSYYFIIELNDGKTEDKTGTISILLD